MLLPAFARILITVPLLALPLAMLSVKQAAASGAAEEAVRILSKARSADRHCNYLTGGERAELSRYTARAEIAAASQASPRAAKKAAAAGTSEGGRAACSPELQADVRETLAAAREAMASATAEPAPVNKKIAKARHQTSAGHRTTASKSGASLSRYEGAVRAYYLERECRSLSKREAGRFWSGIVRLHKAAVAANGAATVAPVMRSAERRARSSGCGNRAVVEIRQGYEETVSR